MTTGVKNVIVYLQEGRLVNGRDIMTKQTLERLPQYLNILRSLPCETVNVSATQIAAMLGLNHVQVRKDLAQISNAGKPKVGYNKNELISDIEEALGYNDANDAILVGVGNLGGALMKYGGFKSYGLNILAGFDKDESVVDNKKVFHIDKLENLCARLKVKMAIITTPADEAQAVCDRLVSCGILAVWNFAPVHLRVPGDVIVQQENMSASLAILSKKLTERLKENYSSHT